ncbi:E3 ubiquitin-protein ligase rnf168 [Chanos chanos]|uniref:RING-type E3 ubiquitin transferase n=1 Tax=Chanos chanos TaxID=29144 RepID=A0A6J2VMT4_CHACN|nr:E3 ubiquitin-protein ligase RNF168 [Chanos chanos]
MPPISEVEVEVGLMEEGSGGLSRADCLCPICLEIFLEPVTLPCSHTFCKPCFLETVDKANICCPLCRKRVSTWARLNGRNKSLVNVDLWRRIQDAFPVQCQRRLNGLDDDDDVNTLTVTSRPRVSQPGELRKEYEDQINKLVEEKRALEEAERKASEEYIQRLLAEEEERLAQERRMQEEKQLEDDERLARLLSEELNSNPISESPRNNRANEAASVKKKKPSAGDIEKFLCPVSNKQSIDPYLSPSSSLMANKENILSPPAMLLSPQMADTSSDPAMPELDYYGRPSTSYTESRGPEEPLPPTTPTGLLYPAKRKSSSMEGDGDANPFYQKVRRPPSSPLSPSAECPQLDNAPSPSDLLRSEGSLLQELAQCEEDLLVRRQQEEEDRQLALRLQRELDREEATRAVDRSKGSPDSYPLRRKPPRPASGKHAAGPGKEEAGGAKRARSSGPTPAKGESERAGKRLSTTGPQQPGKTPQKPPVSAPPVPATPGKKGSKQTTLTDMFPKFSR